MTGGGFRIGRLFGIEIRIDWSWLFIFLLISWNLSALFGSMHPEWSIALRWSLAILAALLFFSSVLLHELAHSLVARSRGMKVRSITLFLFGGVSNIQREPPSPGAEFWLTIVGPLTSIVLGIVLIGGSSLLFNLPITDSVTNPSAFIAEQLNPTSTLLMWLGSINILVGFFNLIPAFPLDGGRILRSIFWVTTDNLRKATRWASWIGQAIGYLMIGAGIAMVFGVRIPIFGGGLTNGLWLAFIGWFLSSAAVQSYRQVVIRDVLEDVTVERMMQRDAPTITPEVSLDHLVEDFMMGADIRALPVLTDGKLEGIVTIQDVRKVERENWSRTTVRDVMTPSGQFATIDPEEDASEAFDKLMQQDINQLPVISHGEYQGVLRRRDIMRWLQLQSQT